MEALIDLILDLYVVVMRYLQQLSTFRAEDAKTKARVLDREARVASRPWSFVSTNSSFAVFFFHAKYILLLVNPFHV